MTRREVRKNAFIIIFEKLLRDDPIEDIFDLADEVDEITVDDRVKELVNGVLSHSDELDKIIAEYSKKRNFARIAKLNVAVLRIALYEILYDDKTPVNAAINEAVVLCQEFSYKEDINFVNGMLGAYAKTLPSTEANNG